MHNTSSLYRLQQIDLNLDQARQRLAVIEQILQDDAALQAAEAEAKLAEARLFQAQQHLRELEFQTREQRMKIEQEESTLYSGRVRNPKELQDLQNEVAALKKFLATLEDRQLEAMLQVEEQEALSEQARQAMAQARAHFEEEHAHLRAERTQLIQIIERLEVERQAALGSVSTEDQALYEQLRQSRRGVAIARIVDRSCSACGAMLTPSLVQSASLPTQLVRCSACGRILYVG